MFTFAIRSTHPRVRTVSSAVLTVSLSNGESVIGDGAQQVNKLKTVYLYLLMMALTTDQFKEQSASAG